MENEHIEPPQESMGTDRQEFTGAGDESWESLKSAAIDNYRSESESTPAQSESAQSEESNDEALTDDEILKRFRGQESDTEKPEDEQASEHSHGDLVEYEFNGEKIKVPNELVKSQMMQSDYTQKTQDLAEQRKAFETEREQFLNSQKEFSEQSETYAEYEQQNNIFTEVIEGLKQTDPDIVDIISQRYQGIVNQYDNPLTRQVKAEIDQLKQTQNEFLGKIKEDAISREDKSIREDFYKDLVGVQNKYSDEVKQLGLNIDFSKDQKIIDEYCKDGNINAEDAFMKAYGAQIAKAWRSKAKLTDVKNKVSNQTKVPTAGNFGHGVNNTTGKELNFDSGYNDLIKQMQSKYLNR